MLASLIVGGLSMPALIATARAALARFFPSLAAGALAGTALELATPSVGIFGLGGDGQLRRRRRRRKALTATDLSTALTLATAISKKAAEVFILQRTRAS